jgi:hypothetical protein
MSAQKCAFITITAALGTHAEREVEALDEAIRVVVR